jgi:NAD(P)-dependent dehydrogenase (short-subunit alcohol dehydrogenase family)
MADGGTELVLTHQHLPTEKAAREHRGGWSTALDRLAELLPARYGVTCGAIETFSRILAGELGAAGIRVVCVRPDAIPEAVSVSHSREAFSDSAKRAGITVEGMLAERELRGFRSLGSRERDDRRHRQPDVWLGGGLAVGDVTVNCHPERSEGARRRVMSPWLRSG